MVRFQFLMLERISVRWVLDLGDRAVECIEPAPSCRKTIFKACDEYLARRKVSMSASDAYLIEAVRIGDQAALAKLFDAYGAALNGVILKVVGDEVLAQEVVQDTFVKIWRNAAGYDSGKGRPFTWMVNIARNTAIDMVRSAAVRNHGAIRSLDKTVYALGHDDLREEHDVAEVRDVVGKLKAEHRELIEMAYYKGFSQQEIADNIGLPLGTVKSRTRAALLELRTQLKDHR